MLLFSVFFIIFKRASQRKEITNIQSGKKKSNISWIILQVLNKEEKEKKQTTKQQGQDQIN